MDEAAVEQTVAADGRLLGAPAWRTAADVARAAEATVRSAAEVFQPGGHHWQRPSGGAQNEYVFLIFVWLCLRVFKPPDSISSAHAMHVQKGRFPTPHSSCVLVHTLRTT